jgi:hypothetical protein
MLLFALAVALWVRYVSSAATPIKVRLPWYHTTQEVHEAMVHATKSCSGAEVELRSRPFASAGIEAQYLDVVYIRRPGVSPQAKALLVFGEHARELITVESALDLVRTFCGHGPNAEAAAHVLNSVEVVLVPNANPFSRKQVENGMYCKRTNEHGVDLNRNWGDQHRDENFIKMTRGDEIDPGPHGFSEPETKILRDLVGEEKPDIYLSVHSGAHLLGIQFCYSENAKPSQSDDMLAVLRPINENHCKGACPYGNLAKLVGYENAGCDIDYILEQYHTPYAFTWEIYEGRGSSLSLAQLRGSTARQRFRSHQNLQVRLPEDQQDPETCIRHFNPLTAEETRSVIDNWTGAYLELSELVVQKKVSQQAHQSKLGALALGSWLSKR